MLGIGFWPRLNKVCTDTVMTENIRLTRILAKCFRIQYAEQRQQGVLH